MKTLIAFVLALAALPALADQYVSPHFRSNGTYVEGYHRSSPNAATYDNYSTRGNVNPYTGQQGYRSPDYSPPSYSAPTYNGNSGFGVLNNPYQQR